MSSWKARLENVAATLALTSIGMLVTWWWFLARGLVANAVRMQEEVHLLRTGKPIDLSGEALRLNLVVTTEFVAMGIAMAVAVGALVAVVKQRTMAQLRMEKMLQFTSHELKTPIAGVRALLQSLGLGAVPEERKAEFLKRGLAEVDRLEHLAETILAWQRSVASTEQVQRTPHDARGLVNDVLEHRAKTGVAEQVEVTSMPEVTVLADSDAFRVILENLLDNARKYGGGRTTLEAEVTGAEWRLSVRDQGPGFSKLDAEHLFDPFNRTKHEGVTHGSGLGLYLSQQLAQRMKGRLTAHSDGPGQGAVFQVALAVSQERVRG
jgi:signal transduction histidine kinase